MQRKLYNKDTTPPPLDPLIGAPHRQGLVWLNTTSVRGASYSCGHCGSLVAPSHGWVSKDIFREDAARIFICHNCSLPTFFDKSERQIPGAAFGKPVENISEKSVTDIYEEARRAIGASCFTAGVLCCRKLLMHLAVSKGADPKGNFAAMVNYLSERNYLPVDSKEWVDEIRKQGNEANHEIIMVSREDAEQLLKFSEMLLRLFFEFPAAAKNRAARKRT